MIVYCCADLMYATKIRSTCESLGVVSRPARNAEMLQARLEQIDDGKPNAPIAAVLIDLDLGEDALPLIQQVKAHSPGVPVIAWGPHVLVDLLEAAQQAGADPVMARGAFTAQLPGIIEHIGAK